MSALRSVVGLLTRSRLLLLGGFVLVVFFSVGFADVALTRRSMELQYRREVQRVERLKLQNAQLQRELEMAQQDEHLPLRAWEYFGKTPKGAGVVIQEPPQPSQKPAEPAEQQPATSFWERLLNELGIP